MFSNSLEMNKAVSYSKSNKLNSYLSNWIVLVRNIFEFFDIMPNVKCGHEESRAKCCGTCGKKINFGTRPSTIFLIKPDMEQKIKELLNPEFDLSSPLFPTSQCSNCRLILSSWAKGDRKRKLPCMPNFKDVVVRKTTRSDVPCNCYICLTARYKG